MKKRTRHKLKDSKRRIIIRQNLTKPNLKNPKGNLLLNKKPSSYIAPTGFLLNSFALLVSTLLGFGGFNMQAFSGYEITGYVSRLQMIFLILASVGLILSGVAYANQTKKQKIRNPNFILLLYLAVSIIFLAIAIFGLTSRLKGIDFWGETSFEEIQSTIFFNSLTLASFLILGTLQVILSIMFLKTRMLQPHRLSKAAKTLTLTSGILLTVKAIIDYPLIKEAIFISSYMLKIPIPNNIISFAAPLIYLSAQIPITIILRHNQKPQARQ